MASEKKYEIINIICYRLPGDLSRQLHNEFENRFRECIYLINNLPYYRKLIKHIDTVELLLALSIFHKRVITNLDAVVKFYGTVTRISNAKVISIGGYDLDNTEKNKLLAVTINYRKLRDRFGLYDAVFEYYETRDFLKQVIKLRSTFGRKIY